MSNNKKNQSVAIPEPIEMAEVKSLEEEYKSILDRLVDWRMILSDMRKDDDKGKFEWVKSMVEYYQNEFRKISIKKRSKNLKDMSITPLKDRKKKKKNITYLRLNDEMTEGLNDLAVHYDLPKSDLIRSAIKSFLISNAV